MTTLLVEELNTTTLVQEFTTTENLSVYAIRPYLYVHNAPAGTFTLSLTDSSDNVLQSQTFVASDITTGLDTLNAYAYAWFLVAFDNIVRITPATYKIKLSSSGYTFSSSSYIGWIKEHENVKVALGYTPSDDKDNPLSYEIWSYK